MEAKSILDKIKLVFNELTGAVPPVAPVPPLEGTEYELKIGGKVTVDKLETGGVVLIDGNPCVPGDLELADGTILTVGDNGVITDVKTSMAPEPPEPEDMGAKFTAFEAAQTEKFAALEAKLSAYESRFATIDTNVGKTMKVMEEMLKLSQILVDTPAPADPGTRTPSGFKEEKPEIKVNAILFN